MYVLENTSQRFGLRHKYKLHRSSWTKNNSRLYHVFFTIIIVSIIILF